MRLRKLIWFLFLCMLFFFGCKEQYVCNSPYVVLDSDCCLDYNGNSMCDFREEPNTNPVKVESVSYEVLHDPEVLSADTFVDNYRIKEAEDYYDFVVSRGETERALLAEKYAEELCREKPYKCE